MVLISHLSHRQCTYRTCDATTRCHPPQRCQANDLYTQGVCRCAASALVHNVQRHEV
jgi:hypothetical protein